MDQLNVWSQSVDWINIVINLVLVIVPPLVGAAITALAGAGAWASVRKAWRIVRGYVNDPTDALIVLLAARLGLDAKLISTTLTTLGDSVTAEAIPAPEREVIVPPQEP